MNSDNSVLDLRDLFDEYDTLMTKKHEHEEWLVEMGSAAVLANENDPQPLDEEEKERFAMLTKLDQDLSGLEDASRDEPTLINEDYFPTYVQEMAADIVPNFKEISNMWPFKNNIDWDSASEELKADYNEVEFDGETYLHRAY